MAWGDWWINGREDKLWNHIIAFIISQIIKWMSARIYKTPQEIHQIIFKNRSCVCLVPSRSTKHINYLRIWYMGDNCGNARCAPPHSMFLYKLTKFRKKNFHCFFYFFYSIKHTSWYTCYQIYVIKLAVVSHLKSHAVNLCKNLCFSTSCMCGKCYFGG